MFLRSRATTLPAPWRGYTTISPTLNIECSLGTGAAFPRAASPLTLVPKRGMWGSALRSTARARCIRRLASHHPAGMLRAMEPDSLLVRGLVDNPSAGLSPALDRSTTFERKPDGAS